MAKRVIVLNDTVSDEAVDAFLKKQREHVLQVFEPDNLLASIDRSVVQLSQLVNSDRRILINTADCITFVQVKDIVRCKSNRNYTEIFFRDLTRLLTSKTLKEFEELLAPFNFVRIHKSHLINPGYLHKFMKADGGHVLLTEGTSLPVAVRKKEQLLNTMKSLQSQNIQNS